MPETSSKEKDNKESTSLKNKDNVFFLVICCLILLAPNKVSSL